MNAHPSANGIRLLETRSITIGKKWNFPDVTSGFWRLYHNTDAGASISWSEGRIQLERGKLYLIPAWFRFSCRNQATQVRHHYAHFDLPGIHPRQSTRLYYRPMTPATSPALTELTRRWRQTLQQEQDPHGPLLHTTLGLLHTLFAILYEKQKFRMPTEHPVEIRLQPALDTMEDRFHQNLSIPEIARRCGLSADHFSRCFKEQMGVSPRRHLREVRLREASRMLAFTDTSIDAVAEQCGFADRYYFTKVFTREMGAPPARYRRRERDSRKPSPADLRT